MLMDIGSPNRSSSQHFELLQIQDGGRHHLQQVAQLSLTNPRDALHHDKR